MKALLIRQPVYEGVLAFVHGMGRPLERFVVSVFGGQLVINTGDQENSMAAFVVDSLDDLGDFEVLQAEADIPDDLVEAAQAAVEAQRTLNCFREKHLEAVTANLPPPKVTREEPLGF